MALPISLVGQRFGRLEVVEHLPGRKARCKCGCGNWFVTWRNSLTRGLATSCGCLIREQRDLSGQRFGSLVADGTTENREDGSVVWECRCDCGNKKMVARQNLLRGGVKSCGCMKVGAPPKHGHAADGARSGVYKSWHSMMNRCYNEHCPQFADYGGRGIKVCQSWHEFENFLEDMGERPSGKTLDRFPNNDGNYEPANCRWATVQEQNRNKRTSISVSAFGQTKNLKEWADELGVSYSMLQKRLYRGWDAELVLSAPSWRAGP